LSSGDLGHQILKAFAMRADGSGTSLVFVHGGDRSGWPSQRTSTLD
jgi:hypothetical protein